MNTPRVIVPLLLLWHAVFGAFAHDVAEPTGRAVVATEAGDVVCASARLFFTRWSADGQPRIVEAVVAAGEFAWEPLSVGERLELEVAVVGEERTGGPVDVLAPVVVTAESQAVVVRLGTALAVPLRLVSGRGEALDDATLERAQFSATVWGGEPYTLAATIAKGVHTVHLGPHVRGIRVSAPGHALHELPAPGAAPRAPLEVALRPTTRLEVALANLDPRRAYEVVVAMQHSSAPIVAEVAPGVQSVVIDGLEREPVTVGLRDVELQRDIARLRLILDESVERVELRAGLLVDEPNATLELWCEPRDSAGAARVTVVPKLGERATWREVELAWTGDVYAGSLELAPGFVDLYVEPSGRRIDRLLLAPGEHRRVEVGTASAVPFELVLIDEDSGAALVPKRIEALLVGRHEQWHVPFDVAEDGRTLGVRLPEGSASMFFDFDDSWGTFPVRGPLTIDVVEGARVESAVRPLAHRRRVFKEFAMFDHPPQGFAEHLEVRDRSGRALDTTGSSTTSGDSHQTFLERAEFIHDEHTFLLLPPRDLWRCFEPVWVTCDASGNAEFALREIGQRK
jgi:hypothetical protein